MTRIGIGKCLRFTTLVILALSSVPAASSQEDRRPDSTPASNDGSKDRRAVQQRHREQSEALVRQGKRTEAIAEIQSAMAIEREIAGASTPTMAALLKHLATIHEDGGDVKATRQVLTKVVDVERAIHGEHHWHVTDAQWDGRYLEALETLTPDQRAELDLPPELMENSVAGLRKNLVLHRRLMGDRNPRFAQILSDMAASLSRQGNLFAAQVWAERCLAIRKELLGERHPSTIDSIWQLGVLHHRLGEIQEASALLEQAVELEKTTSGEDEVRYAYLLDSLSQLLKSKGDLDGALTNARKALDQVSRAKGPEDAETVAFLARLAELLRQKKDFAAARPLFERAVGYYRQRQQPPPREAPYPKGTWAGAYAVVLSQLARLNQDQRDSGAALKLATQVLGLQRPMERTASGPESAQIELNLAWLARAQQADRSREVRRLAAQFQSARFRARPDDAIEALEAWIKVLSQSIGDDADDVVIPLGRLARLFLRRGDFARAKQAQERQKLVLEMLLTDEQWQAVDSRLALEHIDRLARLDVGARGRLDASNEALDEAIVIATEGRFSEEAALLREIVAVQLEVLGEKDPEVIDRIFALGLAHEDAGEPAQAVASLRRALELNRQVRGTRHPEVFRCLARLAGVLDAKGDHDAARKVLAEAEPLKGRRPLPAAKTMLRFRYHANKRVAGVTTGEEVLQAIHLESDDRPERDITAAEALLAVERRLLANEPQARLASLKWLVERHEARGRYREAIAVRREIRETLSNAVGPAHWRTIDSETDLDNVERLAAVGDDDRVMLEWARHMDQQLTINLQGGNNEDGIELQHSILVLERRVLGERDARCITRLETLGRMLQQQGQFDAADRALNRAVGLRRETIGERHPAFARALWWHGTVLLDQGQPERAEQHLKEALRILNAQFGPEHLATIACLHDWGRALRDRGQYDDARPALERSAQVFRRALGEKHPNTLAVLDNLTILYRRQGDFTSAVALYETMSAQNVEPFGRTPEQSSRAAHFAALLGRMGQYGRAKLILERLLRSARDRQARLPLRSPGRRKRDDVGDGTAHPDFAEQLEMLGELLLELGDSDRALRLSEQSLELTEEILGRDHPSYAKRQALLAAVLRSRGDLDRAESLAADAAGRLRKEHKGLHPDLPSVLATLAAVRGAKGNADQVVQLLEEVISIRERVKGERHPDYIRDLNDLAEALLARNDFARASVVVATARRQAEAQRDVDPTTSARLLANAARVSANAGDWLDARRLRLQALELREAHLARNLPALGERERLVLVANFRGPFVEALDALKGDADLARTAYNHLIFWKGIATASSRAEARALALRQPGTDDRRAGILQHLSAVRRLLTERVYARSTGVRDPGRVSYRQHLALNTKVSLSLLRYHSQFYDSPAIVLGEILDEFGVNEAVLAEKIGPMPEPPTPEQVSAALPERAVLLDLFRYAVRDGEPQYVAFVVRHRTGPIRIELGASASIDQAARHWREALERRADGTAHAIELSRRLWAPLTSACEGASIILLSPDGELNNVPWSALPDLDPGARPGACLLERYAFASIGSVRQLIDRDPRELTGTDLLVVGGVDYSRRERSSATAINPSNPRLQAKQSATAMAPSQPQGAKLLAFPPLLGTMAEVESLQRLYARAMTLGGKATALSGAAATKERVVDALPGKRYVHLATHGFFSPPQLLQALALEDRLPRRRSAGALRRLDVVTYYPGVLSALIWAGVNAPEPSYQGEYLNWGGNLLTAEEVAGLSLSGCELAVLSACETSLGREAGGEGVLGLQRAFHAAGARTVVASLWKVDDAATSVLMEHFYTNLWVKKLTKLEALRQAQLAVLNEPGLVRDRRLELAKRGIAAQPEKLPDGGFVAPPDALAKRSDPALWGAFVLSGDLR